ncbi:MAG: hypothetical protein J6W28_00775 [Clostridia bacterium]|nr:hypothetical protein [Clostridia bacterium]
MKTTSDFRNAGEKGVRMDLPTAWANADIVFVDTSAVFTGIVADSSYATTPYPDTGLQETFRLGVLRGCVFTNLCGASSISLLTTWRAENAKEWHAVARNSLLSTACGGVNNFKPAGLTMYMQKTTEVEGETTYYSYAVSYNTGSANITNPDDTGRIEASAHETLYNAINDASSRNTRFCMYQKAPYDVYSLRVYTGGLLTEAEKSYNHLIDLMGFYQVAIAEDVTVEKLMAIAPRFAKSNFVYDSAVGEEVKASIVAALEEKPLIDYSDMYIKEAASGATLIGLYNTINTLSAEAYDLNAGKWFNKIASEAEDDIVLKQTAALYWSASVGGGLKANGITKDTWNKTSDIRMELPVEWAALADLTVESAQIFYGVETDALHWPEKINHMKIDLLRFHNTACMQKDDKSYGGGSWHANVVCGEDTANGQTIWYGAGKDNAWRMMYERNGKIGAGDTMWVNKATAADGSVTYSYGHSYSVVGQNAGAVGGGTYTAEEYEAAKGDRAFYLFGSMAVEVYAIRVYNGALTTAEKQYNHLIDLLSFYQVELPEDVTNVHLTHLAPLVSNVTMVLDENGSGDDYSTTKASLANQLQEVVDLAKPAEKTAYDELYAAQDHLIGLYTAFGESDSILWERALWKNKLGGANATLYDNTDKVDWQSAGDNGGLTLNIGDNAPVKGLGNGGAGIRLNEEWADLPTFTVETSSVAYGIYEDANGGFAVGSMSEGANLEETFCIDKISSAAFFNLYLNNGLQMGFITRMKGVCTGTWWSSIGRSVAYKKLVCDAAGNTPAGLTLVYTKDTTDTNVTFGMSFSTGDAAAIDAGSSVVGSYAYTLEEYAALSNTVATHKFSLYNRGMYDVYAIRVYDKVLNEDELAQNHFVDLLAFYQVEISEELGVTAENFAVLSGIAEDNMTTLFYDDETLYAQTKEALQYAIDNLPKVVIMDETGENVILSAFVGDGQFRLPTTLNGASVLAYYYDSYEMNVYPDQVIEVEEAVTLTAYLLSAGTIKTDASAEVRVSTTGEGADAVTSVLGVRFGATVNYAAFVERLLEIAPYAGVRNFGMLITPKAYVDAAGAFTVSALDAWAAEQGSTAGAYIAISSEGWYNEDDESAYQLKASLVDLSAATLEKNPTFAVVAFIELDTDGDDIADAIIYGEYDEATCFTVKDVVAAAREAIYVENAADPRLAAYDALLGQFAE